MQGIGGGDGASLAAPQASRAPFERVAEAHLGALVAQQLAAEGLVGSAAEAWGPVLVRLAQQAAACLSPTAITANGVIDPRHYIKVRGRVGGSRRCEQGE